MNSTFDIGNPHDLMGSNIGHIGIGSLSFSQRPSTTMCKPTFVGVSVRRYMTHSSNMKVDSKQHSRIL